MHIHTYICTQTQTYTHTLQVFFIKANYMSGEVKLNQDELVDYIWVTKEEMKDYVSQELYDCVSIALPA